MSIIHEALKKTQENLSKYSASSEPLTNAKDPLGPTIKKIDKEFQITWILLGIIAISVFIFILQTNSKKSGTSLLNNSLLKQPTLSSKVTTPSSNKNSVPPLTSPTKISTAKPVAAPTNLNKFFTLNTKPTLSKNTAKDGNSTDLRLHGTMVMENRKVAIINNKVYQIGDSVEGMEIMNISLRDVKIKSTDGIITLNVK